MFKFDEKSISSISNNILVKVYVYDTELKCVAYPSQFDLVLNKDFNSYCEQHKSRLYDNQVFVKGNI